MRILYLGEDSGQSTSAHRASALRRLGHEVLHVNPRKAIPPWGLLESFNIRTGYRVCLGRVHEWVKEAIGGDSFDLAWINGGELISPGLVSSLRRCAKMVLNYNNDDPFGKRDLRKWAAYLAAVPAYDLLVVVRAVSVAEAYGAGARRVIRVFMTYDPVEHAPQVIRRGELREWTSQVVFVGSWMPERGPFFAKLLDLKVPFSLWGDRWSKAREWSKLRCTLRGPALAAGDYVKAIQCAKVALGLLSVGNRDLHTQRSSEIPYIGGAAFCAQRTAEHQQWYQDGVEAVFWESAEDCASKCFRLLENESTRRSIAARGRDRVLQLDLSNDTMARSVLEEVVRIGRSPRDVDVGAVHEALGGTSGPVARAACVIPKALLG